MKKEIQPTYYQAKVACNCGNEFVTGSTTESIRVEICSKCHPFYTGTQKSLTTRGRIDKFNRKYGIKNEE
ncbi:LSU ribosomal protein L31P [Natranaerovirga hydrolytica]|uniref:Large ribosomal subunit protein bL31 n=1 Tax=Natranaerovirga hydrolytica TaxID=680378 RepID=A0A4R1MIG2_9FIRM|nr:50S ribosomal protein L31 [Natranaerovirga hydrolytica]TCK92416.1 LSU ribosomal protein L31P [Natranaerovirga hydrolytica]